MTDTSTEAVERLAKDCDLARKVMSDVGTFETGQAIMQDAAATLCALLAERDAAIARAERAEAVLARPDVYLSNLPDGPVWADPLDHTEVTGTISAHVITPPSDPTPIWRGPMVALLLSLGMIGAALGLLTLWLVITLIAQ
jgi:hypothetical protein